MKEKLNKSKYTQELFDRGECITVEEAADAFYGDTSEDSQRLAQILILSNKRKIENNTGKVLHCDKGTYSLIDRNDVESMDHEEHYRATSAVNKLKSYHHVISDILKHFPELIPQVKEHLYALTVEMNDVELKQMVRQKKHLLEEKKMLKQKRRLFGFLAG